MKEYRFLSYENFLETCNKMHYYDAHSRFDEVTVMNLLYTNENGKIDRRNITVEILEELAELVVDRTVRKVDKEVVMGILADRFNHVYIE